MNQLRASIVKEVINAGESWIDNVAQLHEIYYNVDINNMDDRSFVAWLIKFNTMCKDVLHNQIETYSKDSPINRDAFDKLNMLRFEKLIEVVEKYNKFKKAIYVIITSADSEKFTKLASSSAGAKMLITDGYYLDAPTSNRLEILESDDSSDLEIIC